MDNKIKREIILSKEQFKKLDDAGKITISSPLFFNNEGIVIKEQMITSVGELTNFITLPDWSIEKLRLGETIAVYFYFYDSHINVLLSVEK